MIWCHTGCNFIMRHSKYMKSTQGTGNRGIQRENARDTSEQIPVGMATAMLKKKHTYNSIHLYTMHDAESQQQRRQPCLRSVPHDDAVVADVYDLFVLLVLICGA
jgi:hypothetical protein